MANIPFPKNSIMPSDLQQLGLSRTVDPVGNVKYIKDGVVYNFQSGTGFVPATATPTSYGNAPTPTATTPPTGATPPPVSPPPQATPQPNAGGTPTWEQSVDNLPAGWTKATAPGTYKDASGNIYGQSSNGWVKIGQESGGDTTGNQPSTLPTDITSNPMYQNLSNVDKLIFQIFSDYMSKLSESNQNITKNTELTDAEISQYLHDAQNDPNIQKYYGDQLKLAERDLNTTIDFMRGEYTQQKTERDIAQEQQRKQLAENEAEAGRAYSGFREQAKGRLATEQSGVIQSSQRQLQRNLYTTGSEFERKYGSANLPSIGIGESTYTPYGGISGEIKKNEDIDIRSKYQELIRGALLHKGIT